MKSEVDILEKLSPRVAGDRAVRLCSPRHSLVQVNQVLFKSVCLVNLTISLVP